MKVLLVLTLLFGLCFRASYEEGDVTCECGKANPEKRIVGGRETGKNEFPWMAALVQWFTAYCGAVILTKFHLMSAAHCTRGELPSAVFVAVGSHNIGQLIEEHSRIHSVKEIHNHENFDTPAGTSSDDITILVLNVRIPFDQYLSPICFPTKNMYDDLIGEIVKVTGWGKYEDGRNSHRLDFLRVIEQEVLSETKCQNWNDFSKVKSHLCLHSEHKNVCHGDSGGPAAWLDSDNKRYILVGIISYGIVKCGSETPSVYANVSYYVDWALKKIKDSGKEVQVCNIK